MAVHIAILHSSFCLSLFIAYFVLLPISLSLHRFVCSVHLSARPIIHLHPPSNLYNLLSFLDNTFARILVRLFVFPSVTVSLCPFSLSARQKSPRLIPLQGQRSTVRVIKHMHLTHDLWTYVQHSSSYSLKSDDQHLFERRWKIWESISNLPKLSEKVVIIIIILPDVSVIFITAC